MTIQRLWSFLPSVLGQHTVRRFVTSLALLALIIMGLPALSGAQQTCQSDGDVDQNGSVTAADALLVFQQALSLAQLNDCQRSIADVFPLPTSPDGNITASDALCIFQKALSLPSCLDTLPSANQPPVADAGPDQFVDAGTVVVLSGTGSDPDGTIASYGWTQTGGTTVSLTGTASAMAGFTAPEVTVAETLTSRFTVTDDAGAQANDDVRVTIQPIAPVSAEEAFRRDISGPVVQAKCVDCHVQDGLSGHTRLVFVRSSDTADHEKLNLQIIRTFLVAVEDEGGGSYILNKIQGVQHGGGAQVPVDSPDFSNMERFLRLLGEEIVPVPLRPENLFDTVVLASPRKTLRRAALIFAGRIPTEEEYEAVEAGDESVLRATIRGLMEGPQFHEFLLRASNDRLLTDRPDPMIIDASAATEFVEFSNEDYRRVKAADASGNFREYYDWKDRVQFGFRRAPLELIAHVAENDLPYTEILTADYIMANPQAAAAYGASTRFSDSADPHEFRPSKIETYYRRGNGFEEGFDPLLISTYVLNPGSLHTDYPHAGILNTNVFLKRYPTTATNRNRARARWTYYHFLGFDVEKSASRTTDPAALADTNNPTLGNPACTVCHSVLDPVAGTFQNYSDDGYYKHNWGGLDSLDDLYKEGSVEALAVQAESWEDRETLVWPVTLSAGIETLRVMYTNPFHDEDTDEGGRVYLDLLRVTDADGDVLVSKEFEDLEVPVAHFGRCGAVEDDNPVTGRKDHLYLWWGEIHCAFYIDVEVPSDGSYEVEVVAWSNGYYEQYDNDGFARLSVSANQYQVGDTWFRDMRTPGFNGELAPNPDNSVQWLAHKIVADPRFAEATVKFWWPALMGSEVTRPPEDEGDAGFEGQLLAATAQGAEITRLANGFRRGFHGGLAYNLKALLVEIVLSKWFRADGVTDENPIRLAALRGAGAKRLLTPEELAHKTAAVMGVQWGRSVETVHSGLGEYENQFPSSLTDEYRLLYGGIDSDGVTERGRDLTSVMAGVAKRHAVAVSCPVVMREFYLVPEAQRRLFGGIDLSQRHGDAVRNKLVELHDKLLGAQVAPDSPDVEAAYRLFVEVSERAPGSEYGEFEWWSCEHHIDQFFFEGILDNVWALREDEDGWQRWEFDWVGVDAFLDDVDFSDPHAAARAWKVVLAYLMMDDRYLYLN